MIAHGAVTAVGAGTVQAILPRARVGDGVRISGGWGYVDGIVSAVDTNRAAISPLGPIHGLSAGNDVCTHAFAAADPLGLIALGRAFDAGGHPIDGKPPISCVRSRSVAPLPQQRIGIREPFWTTIPAVDGLLTVGAGARIGIFGSPGSGKSSLLGTLIMNSDYDAAVIGLVGERGREAEEWIASVPQRATIFCATSDRTAGERVRAGKAAMAQAAQLRLHGLRVLLILDSLGRYAGAHREIAIACGDRPGRGGYPPRVFAELAELCEIAGAAHGGSITLFATILNDGDDRDPVSEAARALLDGHIQLSAEKAGAGYFPAIDMLASVSRTMNKVAAAAHLENARVVRAALAELHRTRDARAAGIVPAGEAVLRAIALSPQLDAFLYNSQPQFPRQTQMQLAELAAAFA